VLEAARQLLGQLTAALAARTKGAGCRSLLLDLAAAVEPARGRHLPPQTTEPPPAAKPAGRGGEAAEAGRRGGITAGMPPERRAKLTPQASSKMVPDTLLLAGLLHKRSSAEGWGGVARWRKRIVLLCAAPPCRASDAAHRPAVCLYIFRPEPKVNKGGSFLGLLTGRNKLAGTAGGGGAGEAGGAADKVSLILAQVPRIVRGADVVEVSEALDIGEPVAGAALTLTCRCTAGRSYSIKVPPPPRPSTPLVLPLSLTLLALRKDRRRADAPCVSAGASTRGGGWRLASPHACSLFAPDKRPGF
jgi:hypothetical protein